MKRILLFIMLIVGIGLQAQTTYIVNNTNDSGLGSLRALADSAIAGDTIRFSASLIASGSDSIVLTTGEIAFDTNGVVIKGLYTSIDTLYISGNNNSRIFSFNGAGKIVLDSLVLVNGNGAGIADPNRGGAIHHKDCTDTIFLENSIISGNSVVTGFGGGIYSSSPVPSFVSITNSIISGNTATSEGGGVYVSSYSYMPSSLVRITNSIISGNTANYGGGICSYSNTITPFSTQSTSSISVINSIVSGNIASAGGGGIYSLSECGISNSLSSSSINITNSTISGNTAGMGGGIYSYALNANLSSVCSSSVNVTNSTISGNTALDDGGGIYSRAYSHSPASSVSVINSTVYGNTASSGGAGIFTSAQTLSNPVSSSLNVTSSIIAENGTNSSGIYNSEIPTIISNGYNIFSDMPTGTIGSDSVNITSAQLNLQPLAFNGGSTQTLLPGIGSIAIDQGNPNDNSNAQNAPIVGTRDVGAAEGCFALPTSIYITECNSYTVPSGNHTYTQSGIYKDTLQTVCGADSVITIHLSSMSQSTDVIFACNSYTWIDGVTYYSNNNTAIDTLLSSSGCDSIITLDLTISNTQYTTDVISSCSNYTWIDGITYTSNNNTAVDTLLSSGGCDSIVTLDLTILQPSSGVEVVIACDSYTWNGITYTSSNNMALDTLVNAVGCDSIVTLNLTINNTQYVTDVVSACDSYTWIDGITYTSDNNTAVDTLISSSGCDSIVTLDLMILNSTSFTDVITSCSPIVWIDGVTYNQTTNGPTYTLMNSQGCDSIVTLDFTLLDVDTSVTRNNLTLTAQATNAIYQWIDCLNGPVVGATNSSFIAIANGDYQVEVTQNGCVDTSTCFSIKNVSVQEAELIGVNLYPNPTSDVLHIDKGGNQSLEIMITNSAGAIVYQSTSKKQITSIDMSKMATGMYVVTLKNELGVKVEKVVKR